MNNLPVYVSIVFILTTLLTLLFFYKATGMSRLTLIVSLIWLALQAGVASTGFYTITNTTPPRLMLLAGPPLIFIVVLFLTHWGRQYIDNMDLGTLTILHVIRIPVEIVLMWLFVHKCIPEIMTYDGRNYDILSGMTAPIIYYFGFIKKRLPVNVLLLWNAVCLFLLANVVVIAVLSAPTVFQKFAFEQPNIGIGYFPYAWLPCFIVPVVLLSHLATIRQLVRMGK